MEVKAGLFLLKVLLQVLVLIGILINNYLIELNFIFISGGSVKIPCKNIILLN